MAEGVDVHSGSKFNFNCDICVEDGIHMEAHGYCVNCKEYLCANCLRLHKRTRFLRHHDVLEKHKMPQDASSKLEKERKSKQCQKHKSEPIRFHCRSHNEVGCGFCIAAEHSACKDVCMINESTDAFGADEYKEILKILDTLNNEVSEFPEQWCDNKEKAVAMFYCSNALDSMAYFRQEVKFCLDKLEHTLYENLELIKNSVVYAPIHDQKNKGGEKTDDRMTLKDARPGSRRSGPPTVMKTTRTEANEPSTGQLPEKSKSNYNAITSVLSDEKEPSTHDTVTQSLNAKVIDPCLRKIRLKNENENEKKVKQKKQRANSDKEFVSRRMTIEEAPPNSILPRDQTATITTITEHDEPIIRELPNESKSNCNAHISVPKDELMTSFYDLGAQSANVIEPCLRENVVKRETESKANRKKSGAKPDKELVLANNSPKQQNKTTATFVRDINIRSKEDLLDCNITGMINLSKYKLILVDNNNSKLKLIKTRTYKMHDMIETISNPWDICAFRESQVAVTVPSKQCIQIFKVTGVFIKERHFQVNGECHGITFSEACQYQFIVSFVKSPRVEVMDLNGRVLRRLEFDNDGNTLFRQPEYLCASKDGRCIYVSDLDDSKISMLHKNGRVFRIYSGSRLDGPKNVCIDENGDLFVSGYRCKTVHMVTQTKGTPAKVILKERDGLDGNVHSLSVNSATSTLFVGMRFRDSIKAYNLSY